ncbi:hypothetical protein EOD23_19500 [Mesorhizobium sp. USDA-HM6]|nr:hypothetical protein EOD23_19500 [Mesorhizobium sp. USDA-HM6]
MIRGKRRVGSRRIRRAQSPRKAAAGDVKDFTEAARRTIQFPANLQQASAASGAPANINLLHAPSIRACKRAEESRGLHDKFTAHAKRAGPHLLFVAVFDKWAADRLFPVPFVTEW